jgi:four helix bundle protein
MSKIETYKDLKVWQLGIKIVEMTYLMSQKFPDDERFGLTSQIRRCSVSVPSNIAEGFGRGYSKHYVNFLKISRGSLFELETQFYLAFQLNFIKEEDYNQINDLVVEEGKMINSLISKLKSLDVEN